MPGSRRPRTARSAGGCARRSRCCGGPPTCAPSRPSRSTRSARRWPCSTRRCSRSCPGCIGRPMRPWMPPRGRAVRTGERPPRVPAFLRYGSWIGGDRDGNPFVTAETTERTLRIQADHVLHGLEAVALRLMQTVSVATSGERGVPRSLATRLGRDAEDLPETDRQLRRRFPDEPYRQRFGFIAERLRRTRIALTDEAGPRAGGTTTAPTTSMRSWRSSRRRSSRRASGGSPGARSPSCAGSSRRSGSTSPRSRSASTATSIAATTTLLRTGRTQAVEVEPWRHRRGGPRHVPGDRRPRRRATARSPAGGSSCRSPRRPRT